MADPSEELVVEVEVGIADPPFIAIPRGQVLSPMSVGKRGMWRIEGSGILDVHGYVYFDGKKFFLQSVDERAPVIAHGQPIGRSWTSVSPPCKIEMGSARLHFRATYTEPDDMSDQATQVVDRPPIPMDRPFKPGEFANRPDSEATRVQPLEPTGPMNARAGQGLPPPPPPPPFGLPPDDLRTPTHIARPLFDQTMRMRPEEAPTEAAAMRETTRQPGLVAPTPTPYGGHQVPLAPPSVPQQQQHQQQQVYGPPLGPPPGQRPAAGPGAPNPQLEMIRQKWDELSGPKKILVALVPALMVSLYFLFLSDDEPPRPVRAVDAGAPSASVVADAGAPLPPPPSSTAMPTVSVSQLPTAMPPPTVSTPAPALPAGQRTLERQAVDYVASGQYEKAASAYDQLAQQYPDRPAYKEAARILRAKLDAGVP